MAKRCAALTGVLACLLALLLLPQHVAAQATQLFNSSVVIVGHENMCTTGPAGGTDAYACTFDRAITTYFPRACYAFVADVPNSGGATLNLHNLGAVTITKVTGGITTPLVDNDIRAGQLVKVCYDGTNMQMVSQLGNAPVGSALILDLTDNGVNESTALTEIATTGDTNSIFTEPSADKLLINVGAKWPATNTADALATDPTACPANQFVTDLAAAGTLTCAQPSFGNLTGTVTTAQITDDAVTFAKMQNMATDSFLGRDTTGTGDVEVLTPAASRVILDVLQQPASNGLVARTAAGTGTARTLTAAAGNNLTVSNGDGVAGNPTIDAGTNLPKLNAANTYTAGQKQSFAPSATTAGLNVGSVAGDPSTPANGDLWYDSTANELTARINGATVALGAAGGGGVTTDTAQRAAFYNSTTTVDGAPALTFSAIGDTLDTIAPRITSSTATATLGTADGPVVNCAPSTASNITLTLPVAATTTQRKWSIIKTNATTTFGQCLVDGNGSETINGSTSTLAAATQFSRVDCDLDKTTATANWSCVAGKTAIDLATDVTGDLAYANLTPPGTAAKLLGRGDTTGDWQEITLGTNLSMSGTTLNAAGGSGTPGGSTTQAQYNNAGAFAGSSGLTLSATAITSRVNGVTPLATNTTLGTHNVITCDASGAARTFTLPAASGQTLGRGYRLVKVDSSPNACVLAPASGERLNGTVDGTQSLTAQHADLEALLVSTSTPNWQVGAGLPLTDVTKRYLTVECVPDGTTLTTGTGKCFLPLYPDFNGWNFVGASAHLGAAVATGTVTVDVQRCGAVATGIRCSGTNVSVFSTLLTIDANEDGTETATPAVINPANQALATGQWLRVDLAGTITGTPQGLYVTMVLQRP